MKKYPVRLNLGIGLLVLFIHSASAQWVQTNGPVNVNIQTLAVSGSNVFAGTRGEGIYLSTNNGASWTEVNSGLTYMNVLSLEVSGSNIFAGTNGSVFLSTNNGASWTAVNNGLLIGASSICLAASGSNIFAGTADGVFLSTNNGTSWTSVSGGLTDPDKVLPGVVSLAVSGGNIFTSTCYRSAFLSTNNGTTWARIYDGPNVSFLAAGDSTIFVRNYSGGVFLSANDGTGWPPVDLGLTNTNVRSGSISGGNVFAGTDSGVFLSTNNGKSWTAVNSGLTDTTKVYSLAVNDSTVFAGTESDGVWRRPLSEMIGATGIKLRQGTIKQVHFIMHFPGRTNPDVTIEFSLPHSDQTAVKIFNLSGREIVTLVNQNLGAGLHRIPWNTRNLALGCYIVKMHVGTNTFVKSFPISR